MRFSIIYAFFALFLATGRCEDSAVNLLDGKGETMEFQAEVSRLMDIIISSIYSQKEIFLRELVSNSADALEKVRFLAVGNPDLLEAEPSLRIRIQTDPESQTLTITDTGVGMTKDELVQNLGTVARSGTTNFLEAVASGTPSDSVNLIGQFGVGFYSAFLVADRVTVASRPAGQDQYVWQSNGAAYAVAEDPRGTTLSRGTEITLHLKDDAKSFLDIETVKEVVKKYNQFVNFPIYVAEEEEKEVPKIEAGLTETSSDEEGADAEHHEGDSDKPKETVTIKELVWKQVNTQKPLWLRSKDDIGDDEYVQFFKAISMSYMEPLAWVHFSAEGDVDFRSLLYIPKRKPVGDDILTGKGKQTRVKIYARRVLVTDGLYDFLPAWLNFVYGVVDSDDLPLKVDRESLSQGRMLRAVSKKIVGKLFETFKRLHKEHNEAMVEYQKSVEESDGSEQISRPRTEYADLIEEFGKELKYGCIVDDVWRPKIIKLLQFHSSKTGLQDSVSLEQYIERMPEDQKEILFIANENYNAGLASPHVQAFLNKGYEILVLTDPFDEHCLTQQRDYAKKKFLSVEKTNSATLMSEDAKAQHKRLVTIFKPLTDKLKKALKNKISNVVVSSKLVDDAVALSSNAWGPSAYTERLFSAQQSGNKDIIDLTRQRILEVNPSHPLIQGLLSIAKKDDGGSDEIPKEIQAAAQHLLDAALIGSGFHLQEPRGVVSLVMKAIGSDIGVDVTSPLAEYVPDEEDEQRVKDSEETKADDKNNFEMPDNFELPDDFDMEAFQEMLSQSQPPHDPSAHDEL